MIHRKEIKRQRRRFTSKLKKILSNTWESGLSEDIEKNRLQLKKRKYIKSNKSIPKTSRTEMREKLMAPTYIDYYNDYNYDKTNAFLNKLRKITCEKMRKVSIDFENTQKITASAMISFLAEVDIIISRSPLGRNVITFTHPKIEKVESVLKQIGFYDLLNKKARDTPEFEDVSYWNYASGVYTDTQQASEAMTEIEAKISQKAQRKLYKGFSEAMANCVEHAYHGCPRSNDDTTRWWAFAGVKENVLVVVICDKGIGIPKSLPLTRTDELIESLRSFLKLTKLNDSAMIKIASRMGRTRTNQGNRGKGLKDIRAIIDSLNEGSLSIYSNKGYYRYYRHNKKLNDRMKEHKSSICGTIVEWSIPLSADMREV